MIHNSAGPSDPGAGFSRARRRSMRPRKASDSLSVTGTTRSSSIVHSAAIQGQSATIATFSPSARARKSAFRHPPVHQSGKGLPAAWQKPSIWERFAFAAEQIRCSIWATSGKRVKVRSGPPAIAASQSCTHFPVELFQTLAVSSAALTPRYFFSQTSAGQESIFSKSVTLRVGTAGGGVERKAKSYSPASASGSRRAS